MQHKRLHPEFLNQIAEYIDATDADLRALQRKVQPAEFRELVTHLWSHIHCLQMRLDVLKARGVAEAGDPED